MVSAAVADTTPRQHSGAAFLEHSGRGPVQECVRLRGTLVLSGGAEAGATLCLTPDGAFLVAATSVDQGVAHPLGPGAPVRFQAGRLGGVLVFAGRSLRVGPGRLGAAVRILSLGKLGPAVRSILPRPEGYLVEPLSELERTWLAGALLPGEVLLGWLRMETLRTIPSWLGGEATGRVSLLLTSERFQAVTLTRLGDAESLDLGPDASLDVVGRRFELKGGEFTITGGSTSGPRLSALVAAGRLRPEERLLEVAWVNSRREEQACRNAWCALVQEGIRRSNPRAMIVAYLAEQDVDWWPSPPVDVLAAMACLRVEGHPADVVAELWRRWSFSARSGRALVAKLRTLPQTTEPWALELHSSVHEQVGKEQPDLREVARADLELAEHLLDAGERLRATEVLEARLQQLPSETLREVLPPTDADPTRDAGGSALRTRLYEGLVRARGEPLAPDVRAATELARLHPLVADRVRSLVAVADGDLAERATAVLSLLDASVPPPRPQTLHQTVRPLSDKLINEVLRHPATRADSPFLGKLQELLAAAPTPDVGMLRNYCEELGPEGYPDPVQALSEVRRALALPQVRAYVSRGAKGVGVRAYEDGIPFVLIGGHHLVPGDYLMTRAELQFALGAELAHLRFGHSRVTSNEVWAGALEKGQEGLDWAFGVLPWLRGWKLADRAVRVTSRVPIPVVRRLVSRARGTKERLLQQIRPGVGENDSVLSTLNEQLIVTHRAMQLTADRAGLVLAQDIRAALRAIFLVRRDYRAEIPSVERQGLSRVLGLRTVDGHLAYQDLAVRVTALLCFYLSDEFVRLRAALYE